MESNGSRIVLDVGKPLWAEWDEHVPLPLVAGAGRRVRPFPGWAVDLAPPHGPLRTDRPGRCPGTALHRQGGNRPPQGGRALLICGRRTSPDRLPCPIVCRCRSAPSPLPRSSSTTVDSTRTHCWSKPRGGVCSIRATSVDTAARRASSRDCSTSLPFRSMSCSAKERISDVSKRRTKLPRSELDVELSLAKTMRETTGAVCVVSSAQNIDRLVTVYRACKRTRPDPRHRSLHRHRRPRDRSSHHSAARLPRLQGVHPQSPTGAREAER